MASTFFQAISFDSEDQNNQNQQQTMIQKTTNMRLRLLTGGALVLAIVASVYGQEKPFTQPGTAVPVPAPPPPKAVTASPAPAPTPAPEPNPVDKFFTGKIPEAIA